MARRPLIPFLQPLLFQTADPEVGFSVASVVDEARAVWFPDMEDQVEVRVGAHGPLAFVQWDAMGPRRHVIVFHPVLTLPDVPIEVVRFIAKHELTHIVERPPAGWDPHHADFWRRELAVGPERFAAWAWIHRNLDRVLLRMPRGLVVRTAWRARMQNVSLTPYVPHLPFEDIPWRELCPEGGAQLRLPPEWAWRPVLKLESRPLSPFAVPLST